MPNVYFAGFFTVLLLAIATGIYVKGGNDREAKVVAIYQARDIKAAAEYQAKETAIQDAYRAKEAQWSKQITAVSKDYQGKVAANEKALDIALTSGRLYDRFAAPNQACGDSATKAPADPVAARPAGTELSQNLAGFLEREASRADQVALNLNLCIGVLESERQ